MFRRFALAASFSAFLTTGVLAQGASVSNGGVFTPGEVQESTVLVGSAVTFTNTNTVYDLTSVPLAPGRWSCSGNIVTTASGTTFPSVIAGMNTTSATLQTLPGGGAAQSPISVGTGVGGIRTGTYVFDLTAGAVLYLSAKAQFTGSAPTMYGDETCVRLR